MSKQPVPQVDLSPSRRQTNQNPPDEADATDQPIVQRLDEDQIADLHAAQKEDEVLPTLTSLEREDGVNRENVDEKHVEDVPSGRVSDETPPIPALIGLPEDIPYPGSPEPARPELPEI